MSIHPGGIAHPADDAEPDEWTLCRRCVGHLKRLEARWAEVFDDMEHIVADSTRRWLAYDRTLKLTTVRVDRSVPPHLFTLMAEARRSFVFGALAGAIVLASSAVEYALNIDKRRSGDPSAWNNLSLRMIRTAGQYVTAIDRLLEPEEQAGGLAAAQSLRFLVRRNKAAHGDHVPDTVNYTLFGVSSFEAEAAKQLFLAQRFVFAWAAEPGNPIVASRRRQLSPTGTGTIPIGIHLSALKMEFHNPFSASTWY